MDEKEKYKGFSNILIFCIVSFIAVIIGFTIGTPSEKEAPYIIKQTAQADVYVASYTMDNGVLTADGYWTQSFIVKSYHKGTLRISGTYNVRSRTK